MSSVAAESAGDATAESAGSAALIADPLGNLNLDDILKQVSDMKSKNSETSKKMESSLTRQRRKSRELDDQVFGVGVGAQDWEKVKKLFDEIDTDGSGSISTDELKEALKRAGKTPTNDQIKKLLEKFDADGNGTLEWDEYATMIKEWDKVMEEFQKDDEAAEAERVRIAKAIAEADAKPAGSERSRRGSKEISVDAAAL